MKKKVLSVALVVVLIAIMVSGTLAYFTDNDEVTNTFTVGSVLIDIWENNTVTDNEVVEFDELLVPIINTQDPRQDHGYIPKTIKVKNTGLNAAYVRLHIAQPVELLGYLELDLDTTTGWKRVFDTRVTLGTKEYIVVTFDFQGVVDPNEFTPELLKGAYLAADVDLKANADGDLEFCKPDGNGGFKFSGFVAHEDNDNGTYTPQPVNVLVYAQAIQSQGFADAASALNAGFGDTNPWQQ